MTHGRVSMLAVVGFLVAEAFHPLFGGQIIGPAIYHLTEVRKVLPTFFEILAIAIGFAETNRALNGWVSPNDTIYKGERDSCWRLFSCAPMTCPRLLWQRTGLQSDSCGTIAACCRSGQDRMCFVMSTTRGTLASTLSA